MLHGQGVGSCRVYREILQKVRMFCMKTSNFLKGKHVARNGLVVVTVSKKIRNRSN
jgi:hypothetical protein